MYTRNTMPHIWPIPSWRVCLQRVRRSGHLSSVGREWGFNEAARVGVDDLRDSTPSLTQSPPSRRRSSGARPTGWPTPRYARPCGCGVRRRPDRGRAATRAPAGGTRAPRVSLGAARCPARRSAPCAPPGGGCGRRRRHAQSPMTTTRSTPCTSSPRAA